MKVEHVILGTGQLGLAIMDELVNDGLAVKLVNRSGRVNEPLPNGVVLAQADVTDSSQVAAVTAGASYVFFCTQPAYHQWPERFPQMTAAVIDGAAQSGAKLIFGSNVYMYGESHGRPLTEDLSYAAETRKGKVRAQMANMLLAAHQEGRLPVIIGRASDFYGPRVKDSALGQLVFESALAGKPVNLVGNIDLPHSYTYIRDFARALINLSREEEAYGRAWHVVNAPAQSTREFIDILEDEIDQPVKIRVAGSFILRVMGLFNPEAKEIVEMLYEFNEPFVVDHTAYATRFDHQPTPIKEGIRETVQWYKKTGDVRLEMRE